MTKVFLKVNFFLFPFVWVLAFVFSVLESFTYSGFLPGTRFFLIWAVLGGALVRTMPPKKKVSKQWLSRFKNLFVFSKFVFLLTLVTTATTLFLEEAHYSNYVFSRIHLQPHLLIGVCFLSGFLVFLDLGRPDKKWSLKKFFQEGEFIRGQSRLLHFKIPHLLFILLILTVILFIPAIGIKFSWIDDGVSILIAQRFLNSVKSFNFPQFFDLFLERSGGRFRPVYWLWQIFTYLFAGKNPTLHYALHFLLVFVSSFLIFKTVFLITKSKGASFFSGSLFLINPINTENWYRLGPQEPIIGFFMIASIFLLIRGKNKWLPIFFLLLAFFSKETAFALFPAALVLYLGKRLFRKKRDFALERYSLISLIFFGIMLFITSRIRTGYSQFYVFDIQLMIYRFLAYIKISLNELSPFFSFLIVAFLLRSTFLFRKLKFKMVDSNFLIETFFLIWFVSFLVVQSPWKYVMRRYMLPATIGLFIFMGIELSQTDIILKKKRKTLYKIVVFLFLIFFSFSLLRNLLSTINYGRGSAYKTTHVQKMIKHLAENAPQNRKILLNFVKGEGTRELVYETDLHFSLFHNRPDLKASYLDLNELPGSPYFIVSGTSAPFGYQEEIIERQLAIRPKVEIKSEGQVLIIASPSNLLSQVLKKIINLAFYQEKFTLKGLYAPYNLKDYWKIYYVES